MNMIVGNGLCANVIKLRKTCHSEEPLGDEESTHDPNILGQLGAKILRLPPVAQDDNLNLMPLRMNAEGIFVRLRII